VIKTIVIFFHFQFLSSHLHPANSSFNPTKSKAYDRIVLFILQNQNSGSRPIWFPDLDVIDFRPCAGLLGHLDLFERNGVVVLLVQFIK